MHSLVSKFALGFAIIAASFFATMLVLDRFDHNADAAVVRANMSGGRPIAYVDGPERIALAFDGKSDTSWYSDARGKDIRDRVWIGYRFARPQAIRLIVIEQPEISGLRQDFVRIEKSDGEQTWSPAVQSRVQLTGKSAIITVPPATAATSWRIVAAADNAAGSDYAWTVNEINFFVAAGRQ